jgi:hypothetical protein
LKHFCKSYKRNKKTEKEKKKRKGKYEKGLGETFQPRTEVGPWPSSTKPKWYTTLASPSLMYGSRLSGHVSHLQTPAINHVVTTPELAVYSSINSLYSLSVSSSFCTYK